MRPLLCQYILKLLLRMDSFTAQVFRYLQQQLITGQIPADKTGAIIEGDVKAHTVVHNSLQF